MTDLLNIKTNQERSIRRRHRAKKAIDVISNAGLIKRSTLENGFFIQANNLIPELKSARIEAPAGLITVFSVFNGTVVYESDAYNYGVDFKRSQYGSDYLINKFLSSGSVEGQSFISVIQGQSEDYIISNFPYFNSSEYQFVRTGSFYDLEPGGLIGPDSYQYPDSWPTPSVFPTQVESVFLALTGVDLYYDGYFTQTTNAELRLTGHLSSGKSISGITSFFEQVYWFYRPTVSMWPLPVSSGYRGVLPAEFLYYPFQNEKRYYATIVEYKDGILGYSRVYLEEILHDENSVPSSHNGAVMPLSLREIVLTETDCTCRPSVFYCHAELDKKPTLINVIDLTNTDNTLNNNGNDVDYFEDNPSARIWRISLHILNTETGESWSFTGDQFWSLLDSRTINLTVGPDPITAPSQGSNHDGWSAANNVLKQFFSFPNNNFSVPYDTSMFHAHDGNIYSWSRYYGNTKISTGSGLAGLLGTDINVPSVCDTPGVKPSIFYSFSFIEGEDTYPRYLCICEKKERAVPEEDLPQAQKEIKGIFVGNPFEVDGWRQFAQFDFEIENGIFTLCHVRIAFHNKIDIGDGSDYIEEVMLLGIARKRIVEPATSEITITYHSVLLKGDLQDEATLNWVITGTYKGLNVEDPVFGERWSADLCLFGDNFLSQKMAKYPSPPPGACQNPIGPYSGYISGLP